MVLIYLYKGFAKAEDTSRGIRRAPVIRVIHHACSTGTHAFAHEKMEIHFAALIAMCNKDKDLLKTFTDGGKGKTSTKYLAAVETGLRNFALHTSAMGRVAMNSAEAWKHTSISKKRDCYIAICRYIEGKGSLKPWNTFDWRDFVHLKKLHKTFKTRHWPVSKDEFWNNKKSMVSTPKSWLESKVYKSTICYRCFHTICYRCFHIICYRCKCPRPNARLSRLSPPKQLISQAKK